MDERVVARMESDVLEELAAAEEIHAVIAYYEIDVHDRTVCVVPEETALAGWNEVTQSLLLQAIMTPINM